MGFEVTSPSMAYSDTFKHVETVTSILFELSNATAFI